MVKRTKTSDDPRFHHEIWSGPTAAFGTRPTGICYVENHNAQCGYGELAIDFKMAADLVLNEYRRTPECGNWTAPTAHLVRHTIELGLKALLQAVIERLGQGEEKLLFSHNLTSIWTSCRQCMASGGYQLQEDARYDTADWLITNLHEIDSSGDLFRFGISKQRAFEKQKSYGRVGVDLDVLIPNFDDTIAFLEFWGGVLIREIIVSEMGWKTDPYFDPGDFPRRSAEDDNE